MKHFFLLISFAISSQSFAATHSPQKAPFFLDVARGEDGKILFMNQYHALQYCEKQGAHLPSARELAQLSMSLGAKGIVDSCGTDQRCYGVMGRNADGGIDEFNYSSTGYQRPAFEDTWLWLWFWSSSIDPVYTDYALVLKNDYGDIHSLISRNDYYAVRCVVGR